MVNAMPLFYKFDFMYCTIDPWVWAVHIKIYKFNLQC